MATSDVDLCSRALMLLGADPISSLAEETDNARLCASVYPALRNNHLSTYPWLFAQKRAELTRTSEEPIGWRYAFVLPSDRASHGAFAAYQSAAQYEPAFADWQIAGNRLLANVDRVWVDYTRVVSEADFPPYFESFLVAALNSMIAFAVTDQQNTAAYWQREAFGASDDHSGGLLAAAQVADSQQHPSPQVRGDYDLILARLG